MIKVKDGIYYAVSHTQVSDSTNRYILGCGTGTQLETGPIIDVYSNNSFYFNNSGAYHASDITLKYDIRDILNNDVDELFKTENAFIRYFKWKSTDKDSYGFIAQELSSYCPEAIDLDNGILHINYNVAFSKIIGAMFKKIKQLEKEITELKMGKS